MPGRRRPRQPGWLYVDPSASATSALPGCTSITAATCRLLPEGPFDDYLGRCRAPGLWGYWSPDTMCKPAGPAAARHNWVICTQTTERPTRPRPPNIRQLLEPGHYVSLSRYVTR